MPTNYRQLFAVQAKLEKTIKQACPNIDSGSGIYILTRFDQDENKKYGYIGKANNLVRRCISHLQGYQQRIDISLKKRGFYSTENEGGWKLNVIHFPQDKLNDAERSYIKKYQEAGYVLYNVESGGQKGKTDINERKESRGYRDGLQQGFKNARKEVAHWFDKSLTYEIQGKPNANKEKAKKRFEEFINFDSDQESEVQDDK